VDGITQALLRGGGHSAIVKPKRANKANDFRRGMVNTGFQIDDPVKLLPVERGQPKRGIVMFYMHFDVQ
jgi:hypothetical protein